MGDEAQGSGILFWVHEDSTLALSEFLVHCEGLAGLQQSKLALDVRSWRCSVAAQWYRKTFHISFMQ